MTAIFFVFLYSTGCILALVRHPFFGLMTYVMTFYLHPPWQWWGHLLPDLRWSLIAALVTLVGVVFRRNSPVTVSSGLREPVVAGLLLFVGYLLVQFAWVLDSELHLQLVELYVKYAVFLLLMYVCIESPKHLRWFLWVHFIGCLYLGYWTYQEYDGGRYEGFSSPGINEANAGALHMVTGILAGAALLMSSGGWKSKAVVVGSMPFLLSALVATQSRSGFLAIVTAGLLFVAAVPGRYRTRLITFGVLGVALFALMTNPVYWSRISTLQYAGDEVEGKDTGAGRLYLIEKQWVMFRDYPMGCGHRCTAVLSPAYLSAEHLSNAGGRSSHNTVMTMLVEHGIAGLVFYGLLGFWVLRTVFRLRRVYSMAPLEPGEQQKMDMMLAAAFASLGAMFLGDIFVDYVKLEARLWFVAVLLVMLRMAREFMTPGRQVERSGQLGVPRPDEGLALLAGRIRGRQVRGSQRVRAL